MKRSIILGLLVAALEFLIEVFFPEREEAEDVENNHKSDSDNN